MGRAFYLAIYISHDGMLGIYCRLIICKWFRHSILALVATIFKPTRFYIFLQIYKKNILSVEKSKLFILFNNLSLFVFIHNYFSCLVIIWMQSMFNG